MKYNQFQKNGSKKYIVFDVDETLGYFSQFGAFMDAISFYDKDFYGFIFDRFNEILDLYPEFIRPRMIDTLKYINEKKLSGKCSGVIIYTNNQGPRMWVQHIAKYFDYKVGNVERNSKENKNGNAYLFDKIIAAYMVNGKIIEEGRTSQNKTYDDLLRITGISPYSEVCFVDDLNHPEMRHKNVLYLNVKPYVKTLSIHEMIQRYLKSPLASTIVSTREFIHAIRERMGFIKNANQSQLNLHNSNYISLQTQTSFDSALSSEDIEYKNSGDKLFNYIKLFLKIKQHSKRGTNLHSLHTNSQTRRRRNHSNIYNDKNYLNSGMIVSSLSTHQKQTRKYLLKNRKRLHLKTRKNGAVIMRI